MPEGKPIPTELRNEEAALRQEIDLEDEQTAGMSLFYFYVFPNSVCQLGKLLNGKFGGGRFQVLGG